MPMDEEEEGELAGEFDTSDQMIPLLMTNMVTKWILGNIGYQSVWEDILIDCWDCRTSEFKA